MNVHSAPEQGTRGRLRIMTLLLAVLTFVAALAYDWVEALYVRAASSGPEQAHRGARLSVAMYAVGCVGFFVTLRVSLWYMLPECAGLYVGSWLALRRRRDA